jgi:hypothetical protein
MTLSEIAAREQLRLALDELAYFAHWVTPEIETRRFDTRFFVAARPPNQDAGSRRRGDDAWRVDTTSGCDRPVLCATRSRCRHRRGRRYAARGLCDRTEVMTWARTRDVPRVQPGSSSRATVESSSFPRKRYVRRRPGSSMPKHDFLLEGGRWRPIA